MTNLLLLELTHYCLDLIGVEECEDVNLLVEVVAVDAETHVDNSLVQIWRLKFCQKAEFLLRL